MDIEEVIKEMGFEHVTGGAYRHEEFGLVSLKCETWAELAHSLIKLGSYLKQKEIRAALGVSLRGE